MKSSSAANMDVPSGHTLDGLEEFYDAELSANQEVPGNSQGTAKGLENFTGIARWLTVEEAAKRLEISPNAVIKRLGKGKLAGRKVPGQFGEKWMVDPSDLPQEVHVHISEEQPDPPPEAPGNSQGTASTSQEQPSVSDSIAKQSFDVLADVIRQQTEQIKLQNEMIKHLSVQVQEKDGQLKFLTDSQHKRGWWARFASWFVTGR